jgi:hypothetical protein
VVKRFHRPGQGLWTQLANGGNPYQLATLGLRQAIASHVTPDGRFGLTHFLSFSASEDRARHFACDRFPTAEEPVEAGRSGDDLWPHTEFLIFSFDVSSRTAVPDLPGLFSLSYAGGHRAAIIDVVAYLRSQSSRQYNAQYAQALQSAQVDREWLVLPFDTIGDGTLSALLLKSDELDAKHFVEPSYFIDHAGGSGFIP